MDSFSILNSRKRAMIALVHSVFFLGIATLQAAVSRTLPFSSHGTRARSGLILLVIYAIVTTVLLLLLRASGCIKEKLYFALCASSAGLGLLRILLGDPALHANLLRVILLGCAVVVGFAILRVHSSPARAAVGTD